MFRSLRDVKKWPDKRTEIESLCLCIMGNTDHPVKLFKKNQKQKTKLEGSVV